MSFQSIDEIEQYVRSGSGPSVRELYDIWKQRVPVAAKPNAAAPFVSSPQLPWLQSDLALVAEFAGQALRKEEFLLVRDLYAEAGAFWQKEAAGRPAELLRDMAKLKCHYARAAMRLGQYQDAQNLLSPLALDRHLGRRERARVLLLLGDILRESAAGQPTRAARQQTAEEALDAYLRAQKEDEGLQEAAVLAATMTFLLSENQPVRRQRAQDEARQLLPLIDAAEDGAAPSFQSTLFRAMLLCVLERPAEAADVYARLQSVPGVTTSELAEARFRSQFLAGAIGQPGDFFKSAFPPLQLVVFAGHIPDLPGREPRFPFSAVESIRAVLRKKLDQMQARVGLVSAAAGADLLFIEALLERPGSKYHVVLPWSQEEFYRTSIEPFEPPDAPPFWKPLFDRALGNAATVRELGQVFEPGGDVGWEYTQEVTAGVALLTACASCLDIQPLALWDGQPGYAGGTASFVHFWNDQLKLAPTIIDLMTPDSAPALARTRRKRRVEHETMQQEVKTMLFADIVGYSKLTEKVIRNFVEQFMQRLSILLATNPNAPRHISTWGDALYAVFDYTQEAGKFALTLTRMIRDGEKDWIKNGLFYEEFDAETKELMQRPLNIRIGLHTGPVLVHYNPVVRQLTYTGSHVSRAARIEPVAAPGEVYASEEFAALAELGAEIARRNSEGAAATGGESFNCEYAGSLPLAKNFPGRFRIYRLSPQRLLAMEELAQAAHDLYCAEQTRQGKTAVDTPALRPWDDLPEDLRDSNRAQVADIPNKLYSLGYELAPGHGIDPARIEIDPAKLEVLSEREHERWMRERLRKGWTLGPRNDDPRKKLHPDLLPYAQLSDTVKQKDRDAVLNMRALIDKAGLRVRKLAS